MFDLPFDFFAVLIAVGAFIFALKAFNQVATLRARLEVMEAAAARPMPRQLTPPQAPEQALAPALPGMATEPPAAAPEPEIAPPGTPDLAAAPEPIPAGTGAMPPPLPPAEPGFEETGDSPPLNLWVDTVAPAASVPDLNAASLESAIKSVKGTARSMGIEVTA